MKLSVSAGRLALAAMLLLPGANALAQHLDDFELDGDPVDVPTLMGDDWDVVNSGGGDALVTSGVIVDPPDESIFFTGSSKDLHDVSDWLWTDGAVPDKDNITNAYAAAYPGDVIYFGADRFATNGSSQIGFWFFKDDVTLSDDGTFVGNHRDGDLLILSDFVIGGKIALIDIYRWLEDGTGSEGFLDLLVTGADCTLATPTTLMCATVNQAAEASPWPYTPKTGPADVFATGAFFEGGVDLGALQGNLGCFNTFMAETRSSHSVDAQLKDFVLGGFETCELDIVKTGTELSKRGDDASYTFTITNKGIKPLHLEAVTDSELGDLTAAALAAGCGTLTTAPTPGSECTFTVTRAIPLDAPDPYINTVTAQYNSAPDLTGDIVSAYADHTMNLFQPGVSVTKTGDDSGHVGQLVWYDFVIRNTGSFDSPTLVLDTVFDDRLGDLTAAAHAAGCSTLYPEKTPGQGDGQSCIVSASHVITATDPDPLPNEVTVDYHPQDFPNVVTAADAHILNIFQPSITLTKSGTELSKIGDPVTYVFTVANTSSSDSPALALDSFGDDVLGDLTAAAVTAGCDGLAPGAGCSFSVTRTVAAGSPDPLVNTATAHYHPAGYATDVSGQDSHSVDLFQPAVTVTKTGDALALAGEPVTYTFTVTATGSSDTPPLVMDSMIDSLLGDLTAAAKGHGCTWLSQGEGCTFSTSRVALASDPDPTPNTVVVHLHPDGFTNDISDEAAHSVNPFQPSVEVIASGDVLSKIGDSINYEVQITNTSSSDSPDLYLISVTDTLLGDLTADASAAGCSPLAPGATCSFATSRTVQPGDPDPLSHVTTVDFIPAGFATHVTDADAHATELFQPEVDVVKSATSLAEVGVEVVYTFTISNPGSLDGPPIILDSAYDSRLGSLDDAAIAAGCGSLAPGASCTFLASHVVAGSDPDPLVNEITVHYHPDGFPNDLIGQDDHSLNLFQAAVRLDKTGTALSKKGDPVNHTFTVTNESSSDTPALALDSLSDSVLGDLTAAAVSAGCDALAYEATCSFTVTSTVPEDAPDPLVNTATVHYHAAGFANDVTSQASHSVNLFQPSVDVTKAGDVIAVAGATVTYDFTIENTGSDDSPDLVLDSVDDTVLGDLTQAARDADCDGLAPGATCTFSATREVLASDPDPLDNTVTVHFHPAGFSNDISAWDDHSVNLVQPGVQVAMAATPLSKVGDPVTYDITISCAGSTDTPSMILVSVVDSLLGDLTSVAVAAGCSGLAPGASCHFQVVRAPQAGDPDPLSNEITVTAHAAGFPAQTCASTDSAVVELFQPALGFTMTSQQLAEVGTVVAYEYALSNQGSTDGPALVLDSLIDTLFGDLGPTAIAAGCGALPAGGSCSFTVLRAVQAGDPDPLLNSATAHYHPNGFPNDLMATVANEVQLFQAQIAVTKTGDTLGKVGDPVTYRFTVDNPSSADTPDLALVSFSDTVLGDLAGIAAGFGCSSLASGATCTFEVTRDVQPTDPDPLYNEVTVVYSPAGFDSEVSASDDHFVELFQPGVTIDVSGPDYSKHGDTATFTYTVTNGSSPDSPPVTCSVIDSGLGYTSEQFSLNAGELWQHTLDHVVSEPPDGDPLVALAALLCTVDDFGNVLGDEDSHAVDLVHPDLSVTKSCLTDPVAPGASANFRIELENIGDVPLEVHLVDVLLGLDVTLVLPVIGGSCVPDEFPEDGCYAIEASVIASGEQVAGEVTVTATLPALYALDNVLTRTDDAVCDVEVLGATRTPGFWKTHDQYTCHIFTEHLDGTIDLGWTTLESCADVFGMFWSRNTRDSAGKKRPKECQSQVQGTYHLLAATLNDALDNGAPMPIDVVTGEDLLTAMKAALTQGERKEILRIASLLAAYNEGSDNVAIVDNCGTTISSADPKAARDTANYTAGDCK